MKLCSNVMAGGPSRALTWGHRAGRCDRGRGEVGPVALPDDGQDPGRQLRKLEVGADRRNGRARRQRCVSEHSVSWGCLLGERSVLLAGSLIQCKHDMWCL